jgi:hypothetical protein
MTVIFSPGPEGTCLLPEQELIITSNAGRKALKNFSIIN